MKTLVLVTTRRSYAAYESHPVSRSMNPTDEIPVAKGFSDLASHKSI
jgi:hypothetical protein